MPFSVFLRDLLMQIQALLITTVLSKSFFNNLQSSFYQRVLKWIVRRDSPPSPPLPTHPPHPSWLCTANAHGVNLTHRLLQAGSYQLLLAVMSSASFICHTPTDMYVQYSVLWTHQKKESVMSSIRPFLPLSCPASILSCIRPSRHASCPASVLSFIRPVLHLICPASDMSFIRPVLHPAYPLPSCTADLKTIVISTTFLSLFLAE